jgi:hypothetical protein
MTRIQSLQITSADASAALTPEQKRFNTLIRQIGQARETLALWQAEIDQFRQTHQRVVRPLRAEFNAARRAWVLALDGLLHEPGWNRTEQQTLRATVVESAGALLDEVDGDDAELKAVFARHCELDYETERQQATQAMKQLAEQMTGLDLGDDDGLVSQADLTRRLHEAMDARQAEQAQADRAPRHAKGKAARQREADALQASQSVREVYRKLASALHPDREPDAAQRDAKTALMQRVNQAYAASDLLALLELQLEIEQVDAGHIAQAPAQRVKHYNRVLAEQLAELKSEISLVELRFRHEFAIPPGLPARPGKLGPLISQEAGELRAVLVQQRNDLRLFKDRAATRRWLKQQRQVLLDIELERDDGLF